MKKIFIVLLVFTSVTVKSQNAITDNTIYNQTYFDSTVFTLVKHIDTLYISSDSIYIKAFNANKILLFEYKVKWPSIKNPGRLKLIYDTWNTEKLDRSLVLDSTIKFYNLNGLVTYKASYETKVSEVQDLNDNSKYKIVVDAGASLNIKTKIDYKNFTVCSCTGYSYNCNKDYYKDLKNLLAFDEAIKSTNITEDHFWDD